MLRVLRPYEVACVIARIGILNFFNPLKPEGSWSMDLSRWDQRQVAKMLIVLETHEPGENWIGTSIAQRNCFVICVLAVKQFRWTLDSPPVPGWILTQPWLTGRYRCALLAPPLLTRLVIEEGLPTRGYLEVDYYSGEGARKLGCMPVPKFRKALLYLVRLLPSCVCDGSSSESRAIPRY